MGLDALTEQCAKVLDFVCEIHRVNQDSEVSGLQLQIELGLDAATVSLLTTRLVEGGLVEVDFLLANLWIRPTDLGLEVNKVT